VNTGLLAAAKSESEVAGVLAHEMSHVALRHGAAKETKQKEWRTALQVAGIAAGVAGAGIAGPAINMGGEAGVKRVMSGKYSRDAERDADLNGARMMAAAGYDPEVLAHVLERLSQSASTPQSKGWLHGLGDHPDSAKRAEIIREDIRFYPGKKYDADSVRFRDIQTTLAQLAPAGRQPAFAPAAGTK
jgi:beta-barrel assembly-enhancing protease